MAVRDVLDDANGNPKTVNEGATAKLTAVLKDYGDVALTKAQVATLKFTLANEEDGKIINGRDQQDVYDKNNGTIDANATVVIKLQAADNEVRGSQLNEEERHIAVLEWTYTDADGDTGEGSEQWIIKVLASP